LTRLAAAPFDLVVSDVLMQGLTGFELCRRIKADPALREIPVVLVTTLREPQDIVQALEVGADSFVRKPYDPDALVVRLRSLLSQKAPPTDVVAPKHQRRREDDAHFSGVDAVYDGKAIRVHANREQILRLLLGTFEDVVRANTLLREREEELSVAKRDLEEAARMKDIFFATLSHELRTPLTAIVGWVHILKEGQTDPVVVQRAVETIERNLNVQHTLIADLLDVSRIVSGKLDLERTPLDLPALVRASVDSARPTAAANGIALELDLGTLAGPISGDPARLQQVVTNLLTNSLKFTPRGGKVVVSLVQKETEAVLTVSDSGSGIRAEVLPFVFERFRQASVADTKAGGLGLGLAIVKHIVALHEGTVSAASPGPGQGATFTVVLPLARDATPAAVASGGGTTSADALLAGLRIVVADDQDDSRELIAFLLTRQGAIVTEAASAAEAFAAVKGHPPDVLLSDIEMPDESGYAFIERVRTLPPEEGGAVPAAAMTAHGSREDRDRAVAAGFQRHLAKPFQPAELFALVGDLAGRTAAAGP
ncbi:MAG TPA: response regulator, partial [Vicinamibacteria bacterium]|nr:response regulator [Vicinamibacteria bacterium]